MEKTNSEIKVLCPFCNSAHSAKVVDELFSSGGGCDTCGYGSEPTGTIEIVCENCNKVVYKKEIN